MSYKLLISCGSLLGDRTNNQDNLLVDNVETSIDYIDTDFYMDGTLTNDERRIFSVCDGMGGCSDGHVASLMIVQTLLAEISYLKDDDCTIESILKLIKAMNAKVVHYYQSKKSKGGSTISYLQVNKDDTIDIINIGDSPIYLIRDHQITLVSEEQNVAGLKLLNGTISEEEYETSNEKNQIMGYIGDTSRYSLSNVYYDHFNIQDNDVIVISSDGLLDLLGRKGLLHEVEANHDAETILKALKGSKNSDNVTMIMIKFRKE